MNSSSVSPQKKDRCHKSVGILYEKAESFVRYKCLTSNLLSFEYDENLFWEKEKAHKAGCADMLWLGGLVPVFLKTAKKASFKECRIWVVSSVTKKICTDLLHLPSDAVQLIPRHALYPTPSSFLPFPQLSNPLTLVYGGRLSDGKNIKTLILLTHKLQMTKKLDVRLALCGDFESVRYEEELIKFIASFEWIDPPQILNSLEPLHWWKRNWINPVFISLSTFESEDFGVSLAQVRSDGFPVIVSEWGGHLDIDGPSCIKIPLSLIPTRFDGPHLEHARVDRLLEFLLEAWERTYEYKQTIEDDSQIFSMGTCPLNIFKETAEKFSRVWGEVAMNAIHEGYMRLFWCDYYWHPLNQRYRDLFAGREVDSPLTLVITTKKNDETKLEGIQKIEKRSLHFQYGEYVEFLPLVYLFSTAGIPLVMRAKKIIFAFDFDGHAKTISYLRNDLSYKGEILINRKGVLCAWR